MLRLTFFLFFFQSANNKATPGRVESAGNKSFKFGRKELFDESALPDHYPLHHVKVCCQLIFSRLTFSENLSGIP